MDSLENSYVIAGYSYYKTWMTTELKQNVNLTHLVIHKAEQMTTTDSKPDAAPTATFHFAYEFLHSGPRVLSCVTC